jgi:hypothetical protein
MPDFRGLVLALLIVGAVAGALGILALYGVVSLIGAHVSISWR